MPRGSQRGAATIEAILVFTLFVIIWTGVSFMGRMYQTKLASQAHARSCAWLIASASCSEIPPECEATQDSSEASPKSQVLTEESESAMGSDSLGASGQDMLDSQVDGLFSKRVSAIGGGSIVRPKLLGGETVSISASYSLPCNTKPQSVAGLAGDIFSDLVGGK